MRREGPAFTGEELIGPFDLGHKHDDQVTAEFSRHFNWARAAMSLHRLERSVQLRFSRSQILSRTACAFGYPHLIIRWCPLALLFLGHAASLLRSYEFEVATSCKRSRAVSLKTPIKPAIANAITVG